MKTFKATRRTACRHRQAEFPSIPDLSLVDERHRTVFPKLSMHRLRHAVFDHSTSASR
ncbi:MAG: hypothetical protein OXF74_06675 [Rhodobacteraceae bacterium]|nr:hypothetical protein [Paracoccaceae bacterium]